MSAPRLRLRLREQIPLLLLGVALAVGALCWSLQLHFSLSHVHAAAAGEARETAARLARAARHALDERDLEGLRRELAGLAIHRKVAVAAVFDTDGRLLAVGGDVGEPRSEAALPSAVGLARVAFEARLHDAANAPAALLDNDAEQGRVHLYRGIEASAHTPAALLYLMYDYSDHLGVARRHAELNAVLLALLVALSALLIGWFLHHRVTLRAWRIVDVAERYGHGERGLVCGLAGHDELARIGQALDRMMVRVDDTQARLADAENAQRRLIENLPGAVLIDYTDRPGCTKYASPQLKTLFGHDPAQWVTGGYEYWYAHIHPADRERAVGPWRESCANGTPYFCEYRLMAPDGQFHWVQDMASGASVVVDGERLSYGFMLDVSARRQTEEALREHVHLLKTAQAVAGVGAWSAEPSFEGRVRWSDETCRLFGALPEHFPHTVRAWLDGVHAEDRARVIAAFERLFAEENDGSIELRYRYRRADGVLRWILTHADNVWSSYDDRRLVAGVVRDVTDQIETERRIERLAYHDLLTGLPNRAQLVERLRAALAEARRRGDWIALLYADLDEFKAVNDTLGHAAGDRLLQEVARRIGDARRAGDVVARYGGDEFIVVLSGLASPQEATAMAEQLCARLREPIAIDGQRLQVTTTVGVAVAHGATEVADETLVRQADLALYAAKGAGRNGWRLFSEDLERELQGRRRLESELRRALERGEFVPHYQPQIDLRTGHIVGVEALLRWQHPTRGLVLPGEFIPLAEESRLIVPLGEWVLATALAQLAAWRRAGLPRIRMAVNLSARQFEDVSLPERLRALLHAHAIDPVLLELEVTESCVLRQRELAQDMLERFRALGVSIAIDDFGTGYSNLGALKQYPFARLKIDRLFIRDLTDSDEADALVRAIVAMADALHLPVVAEGVEHAAQLRFLHALGCGEVQGFHTGAPVGAAQIEARFARTAARL